MQNPEHDTQARASGSPKPGEPEFLAVGKLRRPHGVSGEILMAVWTDFPERIKPGVELYVGEQYFPLQVKSLRWHRQDLLITINGCDDRDQAAELCNQVIFVRTDQIPALEDGEIYLHQVLGLRVIREDNGDVLGEVAEIIETGANDVYIVRSPSGSEFLIPAIDDVILNIDLTQGEIRIQPLPGLLPEDEAL